jgi:hypothetical protein
MQRREGRKGSTETEQKGTHLTVLSILSVITCGSLSWHFTSATVPVWPARTWIWALVRMSQTWVRASGRSERDGDGGYFGLWWWQKVGDVGGRVDGQTERVKRRRRASRKNVSRIPGTGGSEEKHTLALASLPAVTSKSNVGCNDSVYTPERCP